MTHPRCILVDDDPFFRTFAREALSRMCPELEVMDFFSAATALDYLRSHGADLIITDYRMPEMNGLELTSTIRETDAAIPIVVISGDAVGQAALEHGATAFVPKRALWHELGSVLERVGLHAVAP